MLKNLSQGSLAVDESKLANALPTGTNPIKTDWQLHSLSLCVYQPHQDLQSSSCRPHFDKNSRWLNSMHLKPCRKWTFGWLSASEFECGLHTFELEVWAARTLNTELHSACLLRVGSRLVLCRFEEGLMEIDWLWVQHIVNIWINFTECERGAICHLKVSVLNFIRVLIFCQMWLSLHFNTLELILLLWGQHHYPVLYGKYTCISRLPLICICT